jgi:hypothetical protein
MPVAFSPSTADWAYIIVVRRWHLNIASLISCSQSTAYSHIFDGKIKPGRIEQRPCTSQMIIHVPVDQSPAMRHKAIVILRNPHNHPMHPRIKPSAEDKFKLGTAVKSTGLTGLTVRKLLNGFVWFCFCWIYHLRTISSTLYIECLWRTACLGKQSSVCRPPESS